MSCGQLEMYNFHAHSVKIPLRFEREWVLITVFYCTYPFPRSFINTIEAFTIEALFHLFEISIKRLIHRCIVHQAS